MVIFRSYVSLPEGTTNHLVRICWDMYDTTMILDSSVVMLVTPMQMAMAISVGVKWWAIRWNGVFYTMDRANLWSIQILVHCTLRHSWLAGKSHDDSRFPRCTGIVTNWKHSNSHGYNSFNNGRQTMQTFRKHGQNNVKTIHVHALASEKVKSRVLSRSHPNNEHHIKNLRSGLWSHRWPKKVVKRGWKIIHILYMDDLCMYKIVFIWHDICVAIFLEDIPTTFHYQTAKSTATGQSAIPRAEKALTRQRSSVQGLLGQPWMG